MLAVQPTGSAVVKPAATSFAAAVVVLGHAPDALALHCAWKYGVQLPDKTAVVGMTAVEVCEMRRAVS